MGYLDGFGVTLKKWFTPGSDSGRRVTLEYPEVVRPKPERFHGRHVLNRYDDGMEKCIGCELCAGVCPAKCIYVRGADNDPDAPTSPGERFGFIYEINYLRCIHCDLCVEACPTEAITESKLFEFAFTNRSDAIYTKAELVVGDDGRPQQLPWENWDGGYDPAELSSGWMRATAPGGDADFVGIVAWAGELGYGVRAPEGGGRVDAPELEPVDDHTGDHGGHDGHDDHDGHDHHGGHDHDHGEPASSDDPEPADAAPADAVAEDQAPATTGVFDAGDAEHVEASALTDEDEAAEPVEEPSGDALPTSPAESVDDIVGDSDEAPVEPAPAPRSAGLFDAGDADLPGAATASSSKPAAAAEPEPEAHEEPEQAPAPGESVTDETLTEAQPADDDSASDDPVGAGPADAGPADTADSGPGRSFPSGSGFFDLPEEAEPEPKGNGKRRRGWGRR